MDRNKDMPGSVLDPGAITGNLNRAERLLLQRLQSVIVKADPGLMGPFHQNWKYAGIQPRTAEVLKATMKGLKTGKD